VTPGTLEVPQIAAGAQLGLSCDRTGLDWSRAVTPLRIGVPGSHSRAGAPAAAGGSTDLMSPRGLNQIGKRTRRAGAARSSPGGSPFLPATRCPPPATRPAAHPYIQARVPDRRDSGCKRSRQLSPPDGARGPWWVVWERRRPGRGWKAGQGAPKLHNHSWGHDKGIFPVTGSLLGMYQVCVQPWALKVGRGQTEVTARAAVGGGVGQLWGRWPQAGQLLWKIKSWVWPSPPFP
jgi:hypothetical protein